MCFTTVTERNRGSVSFPSALLETLIMSIPATISTKREDTCSETEMAMREVLAKTANHLFTHPLESLCDSFFVFYSLWTLTWIVSYFANLSFSAISPDLFSTTATFRACAGLQASPQRVNRRQLRQAAHIEIT